MSDEKEEKPKKTNWAGVAAFVVAIVAAPGVLVNTYFDFKERATNELVQKSSHESMASIVIDIGDDVEACFNEVDTLKVDIAELRGYIRGLGKVRGGRIPASLPAPSAPPMEKDSGSEVEAAGKIKVRRPVKFDKIMQHVQSTGELYAPQKYRE